jgi:hypothetical protein
MWQRPMRSYVACLACWTPQPQGRDVAAVTALQDMHTLAQASQRSEDFTVNSRGIPAPAATLTTTGRTTLLWYP